MMIDTHCHIDDPQYAEGLDLFLQAQKDGGVEKIIVPGVNAASIRTVWEVCKRFPEYLYPAIGLHPEEVKEDWEKQLDTLEDALTEDDLREDEDYHEDRMRYVAVGEIGLDYHFDTTYKQEQQAAFRRQLHWAQERDLPVLIHARDATEDTLRIIREVNQEAAQRHKKPLRGVMHCFSGSHETAEEVIKLGLYLGIGGVITFKNCRLAENLQGIPMERLVLETDAPYMAPVPYRGQRNESRWMTEVVKKLSEVYACPAEQIITQTTKNAEELFALG